MKAKPNRVTATREGTWPDGWTLIFGRQNASVAKLLVSGFRRRLIPTLWISPVPS